MHFILKNRKVVALILIVSQIIVNAGTQVFAASFSKVMSKTLEGMEQPEDISTKYYEEFHYESRTYLFNDGESFDDDNGAVNTDDKESHENEFNENETKESETNNNINYDGENDETVNDNENEPEEYDYSLDDIEGDYEDVPEELDDDGNVIETTRRNRAGRFEYEEEPEEDEEEPEEDLIEY